MSNSKLISCTKLSPNHSGQRTHAIDRITPHCVVGQLSAEGIGGCFTSPLRQASCNYGIGYDGRIILVVDENNRSWCSSSNANDQRAVTIECASDLTEPYAMNSNVYKSLVKLCTDICRRNGKKKLLWFANMSKTLTYSPKSDEMVLTVHRWFDNKSCPGDWLYSRLGKLAKKVTKELNKKVKTKAKATLRKYAYNDPVRKTSTAILTIPKGAKVEWVFDDGSGWSNVKYKGKTGYVPNTKLSKSGLSKYKKIKLAKDKKVYRVLSNNTLNTATTLKTARTFSIIGYIEGGKYKGYYYCYRNGKYYYIYL